DGKPDDYVATVYLDVQFASLVVNDEVIDQLKKRGKSEASLDTLQSYPFSVLKVETGGNENDGLPTKLRWRYPPNLAEELGKGSITTTSMFITEDKRIPIPDSCEQLRKIGSDAQNVQA